MVQHNKVNKQFPIGSCKAAGYEGCCDPKQGAICWGSGGDTCYCDELCYSYGDCCHDVADIGCIGKL